MRSSIILGMIMMSSLMAADVSIQSVYDACGPGEGYDKLLVLDPANKYTGALIIQNDIRSCIHGNGALIYLKNAGGLRYSMRSSGTSTVFDVDHCVIRGANEAVSYNESSKGTVKNCTFYDCIFPVYAWDIDSPVGVTAYNNIFSFAPNGGYAFARLEYVLTTIHHNNAWSTPYGKYMELCPD
jgi:hypothetical protein